MNILAIGAHPDDIEIGCGGTLIKYSQCGNNIYLLIMTDGGMATDPDIRRKEQTASAQLMGAKDVFFANYKDTELVCDRELIERIEETVVEVEPDMIFVHYLEDTHQDHRNLSQATVSATRYIENVLFYEGPSTEQSFMPSVFVNVKSVLNKKLELLEAHVSQVMRASVGWSLREDSKEMSIIDVARSLARFRGWQGKTEFAEGFVPSRLFLDI